MKRIFLFLLIGIILLSGCQTKSAHEGKPSVSLTASQSAAAAETVEKTVRDAGLDLNAEEVVVPEILAEEEKLNDVKVSGVQNTGMQSFSYPGNADSSKELYTIKGYEQLKITIGYIFDLNQSMIDRAESESADTYKKYYKDGKPYYICGYYSPVTAKMMIDMYYYPTDITICNISAYIQDATEITDQLAEKIYDDFQCVTLKDLQR